MVSGLGGITGQVIGFALDGLALRHNAISSNIANSNAVGYRPMRVNFENKISEMLASQENSKPTAFEPSISFGTPVGLDSEQMSFESNLAMLNQNVVQYQALVKGLGTYMAAITEAIKEGRR